MKQAFHRFHTVMAAVASILMSGVGLGRAAALAEVGGYESRGKGRGTGQKSRNTTAQVKRAAIKARNVKRNKGLK